MEDIPFKNFEGEIVAVTPFKNRRHILLLLVSFITFKFLYGVLTDLYYL